MKVNQMFHCMLSLIIVEKGEITEPINTINLLQRSQKLQSEGKDSIEGDV